MSFRHQSKLIRASIQFICPENLLLFYSCWHHFEGRPQLRVKPRNADDPGEEKEVHIPVP